ncbi:hypothetical protein FACS1894169_12100 [Bacteroidia bacterium]|nr:hypothetical protein FACS1894169_12100 [Bacteroidia bacterium]
MENKCYHKLSDILLIGLLTYLSHGEDYEDMFLFGITHEEFLKEIITLENGIPSHDTFNRVFSSLEPDLLRQCLNDHGKDLIGLLSEKQICLDGKKLKGVSPGSRDNTGLYIVNVPYDWQFPGEEVCILSERSARLNCFAIISRDSECNPVCHAGKNRCAENHGVFGKLLSLDTQRNFPCI